LGSPFYHHLSNLCISVVRATSGKRANLWHSWWIQRFCKDAVYIDHSLNNSP
jgi:hypothetical protein